MRKNKIGMFVVFMEIFAVGAIAVWLLNGPLRNKDDKNEEISVEVHPFLGVIEIPISTTGIVLPKNRLQVQPPVNGRMESVLVQEGDKVKAGQILAWMSSTERAALLDAARGKGEETLKYWQEVYKPIPLLSPIDGEVIVAKIQPAQSVLSTDAVIVLSDHLIIRAQVDETDIGKIALGQDVTISLDAYPETKIKATVEHIYYESRTVNNVTMYEADLLPEIVSPVFRSGMNATVDFKQKSKENILMLPVDAIKKEGNENFVLLKSNQNQEPIEQIVKVGMTDDKNTEIVSGLTTNDTVIMKTKKFILPKSTTKKNPFVQPRVRGSRRF